MHLESLFTYKIRNRILIIINFSDDCIDFVMVDMYLDFFMSES